MVSLGANSFPEVQMPSCFQQVIGKHRMGSSAENISCAMDRFEGSFSVDQPTGGLRKAKSFSLLRRSKEGNIKSSFISPFEQETRRLRDREHATLGKDNRKHVSVEKNMLEADWNTCKKASETPGDSTNFGTTFRQNTFVIPIICVQKPDEPYGSFQFRQTTIPESDQPGRDVLPNTECIGTQPDITLHRKEGLTTSNERVRKRKPIKNSLNRTRSVSWSESGSGEANTTHIRNSVSWCVSLNSARETDLCSTDL